VGKISIISVVKGEFRPKGPRFHDILTEIKEQLFDAPSDVKSAFNNVVEYFAKDSKSKTSEKEDYLYDKFSQQGYLSVSEMSQLEKLQTGKGGTIDEARKCKIPHFDSMIVLDMEEGPGYQIQSSPVHKKATRKYNIWNNGKKSPAAIWINQYTTKDGIVYYVVMDNFYSEIVCNKSDLSKLLKGAKVNPSSKTSKGGKW